MRKDKVGKFIKLEGELKVIFYTADLHLGHESIIKISNRPFITIEEHDRFIINNWNATVSDKDTVYIVGDFAHKNKESTKNYIKQLKGHKHLIIGNHDLYFKNVDYVNKKYFQSIEQMSMIKDGGYRVVLCHYPLAEWNGYFRGAYMIHGHIHNNRTNPSFEFLKSQDRALNAGVDITNFKPVTLKELIVDNKAFKEKKPI